MSSTYRFEVIYLTGASGTGKTSLVSTLKSLVDPLHVIRFSEVLREYVSQQHAMALDSPEFRQQFARIVRREDITAANKMVVEQIRLMRKTSHVILDSHTAGKEAYGYRVAPFTLPFLRELEPTMICALYAEPSVVADRISRDSRGRYPVSPFNANFHGNLEATIALMYSLNSDVPLYFLESDRPVEEIAQAVVELMKLHGS